MEKSNLFSRNRRQEKLNEYICVCGHKVDVYVPQTPGIDIRIKHRMHFSAYAYHSEICNCHMAEGTVITDSQGKKCFIRTNGKWEIIKG